MWRMIISLMLIFRYIVQCTCIHTCQTQHFLLTRFHYEFVDMFMITNHVLIWQVVNVGGTWRVGGLLALSRAFGDVYLKRYLPDTSFTSIGWSLCTSLDANIHFLLSWACCSIARIGLHLNAQQFVFPVGPITRLKELVEDLGWQLNHMSLWRHSLLV